MRTWTVAAMMMAALGVPAAARAPDAPAGQREIFEDLGSLTGATEDEGGVWLTLWEPHVRFRVEREPETKRAALTFLIKRASEGYRAISIRYDGRRGRLNRTTGTLDYPVCAIVLDDLRFEPTRRCNETAATAPAGAEGALTLARAYLGAADFRRAQALLAGSDLPADKAFRRIFLKVRAAASDAIGQSARLGSVDSDRSIAAALADYRALALLEPDDVEHQFAIAQALQDLGGYAEAKAVYDRLIARWPDEDFRVAVRRGALYRGQGEYEKALDALNQLVARSGAQEGMRFYYHRAWTLSLLGRYDEAIADLSEGLKSQPDYGSAYLRRACALAAIGRLREAWTTSARRPVCMRRSRERTGRPRFGTISPRWGLSGPGWRLGLPRAPASRSAAGAETRAGGRWRVRGRVARCLAPAEPQPPNCIATSPAARASAAAIRLAPKPSLRKMVPISAAKTTDVSRRADTLAVSIRLKA